LRITTGGHDYQVNDQFGFNIGGLFLRGTVIAVTAGSINPTGFSLTVDQSVPGQPDGGYQNIDIPIANMDGQTTIFALEKVTGSGQGAKLSVEIPQSIWDARVTGVRTEVDPTAFALVMDELERGVSFITYDATNGCWNESDAVQVTGDLSRGNPAYDDVTTIRKRSLLDVYLYNMLYNPHTAKDDLMKNAVNEKSIVVESKPCVFSFPDITIETLVLPDSETGKPADISKIISDAGVNKWNSFIAAVPTADQQSYYTISWSYDMNASNKDLLFPKFSGLNVSSYDNAWSSIKLTTGPKDALYPFMYDVLHDTNDTYSLEKGDLCLVGRSIIKLSSILSQKEGIYPDDAELLHTGNNLNYNLYRFDHLKAFRKVDELRASLSDMTYA
jgi:hypothetical protein